MTTDEHREIIREVQRCGIGGEQSEMAFRENTQRLIWLLLKEYPNEFIKLTGLFDRAVHMKSSPADTLWLACDALCERLATDVLDVENTRVDEPAAPLKMPVTQASPELSDAVDRAAKLASESRQPWWRR